MRRTASALAGSAGVLLVLLFAAPVRAQSTIIGTVQDPSGGVLPGVNVEVASEALIEGTKGTVTDGAGRYRVTDLRPGTYSVTFTLSGFQTLKRSDIALPGEFTATVDAELRVGALTEVINVSVPVTAVDTQSAVVVTRFNRDTLDNLPTGQNIWEIGQLVAGIQLGSPIVAGQGGAVQSYMSVRGMNASQNVVLVDGLSVSGLEANGAVQSYFNNANSQEITYQTSAINADRSGGGVTVNMIPREGGNRFSGDGNFNYRPGGKWIGNNLSSRLTDMGAVSTSSLEYLSDVTVSQGGPIKKDRLWFFSSFHQFNTRDLVPNTVFDDGSQGSDGQRIIQGSTRLTVQLGAKSKFSGFYEKIDKIRTNEMGSNDDPETASTRWTSPNYSTGTFKYTSTLSGKLLLEAGYSFNREYRNEFGQEGVLQERDTPGWFAGASRTSQTGGFLTTAPATMSSTWPSRDNLQASLSYVSARHNMKFGVQYQFGSNYHNTVANADLTQRYETGAYVNNNIVFSNPVDVLIRNTPVESRDRLVRDLGIYAMDTWQMNRLTIGAGLRWENLVAQNDAYDVPAGRFVQARSVPAIENVPNWKDFAPRFTAAYDLFGNAKTALKYSINRYNRAAATSLAFSFNTLSATSRTLPWRDVNGNDIADVAPPYDANGNFTPCNYGTNGMPGCEVDLSNLQAANGTRFGQPGEIATYVPYDRTWNLEQSVQLQHEVTSRIGITASWTRGSDYDLTKTVNTFRQKGDYVPFQMYDPRDGTPITIWSIKDAATRTRLAQGGANLTYNDGDRMQVFNEFGLQFRITPYSGANVFGGFTSTRTRNRDCESDRPELVVNPNDLRFCDEFNLPENLRIPFAHDFRLSGTFPLKWQGIMLGITYLNNDEGSLNSTYTMTVAGAAATRYPDGTAASTRRISGKPAPACPTTFGCVPGAVVLQGFTQPLNTTTFTVPLQPDGNLRWERLYQTDIKVSKNMRFGRTTVTPTLNVYNLFNSDHINSYQSLIYATVAGTYLVPSSIMLGRVFGISTVVRW